MTGRIIITGGTRGIGKAIVERLYKKQQWNIILTSRQASVAENIAHEIFQKYPSTNTKILGIEYNSNMNMKQCKQFIQQSQHLGPLKGLINGVGISKDSLLLRLKDDELLHTLETNLVGGLRLTKAASEEMIRHKQGGSIVFIGSVVGSCGNIGQVAYSASKSALVGVTKTLSKELSPRNIRVNCIEPGFINTDMTYNIQDKAKIEQRISVGRMGEPEEIAPLVQFLMEKEMSSYITGQVIRVDGGLIF